MTRCHPVSGAHRPARDRLAPRPCVPGPECHRANDDVHHRRHGHRCQRRGRGRCGGQGERHDPRRRADATTGANGIYRVTALPAGNYALAIAAKGFATRTVDLELTLNRVVVFDITLQVEGVETVVQVSSSLVDVATAATGATITPRQITELPVNGRNYLDLLQLVPGVAVNRQVDPNSDSANPVLGERSGNNNFLIDGQPNKDTVNGGPAQQFNQETIAEFQVLTTGYKAEFGQASGAIVNVITKSGSNDYRGVGSLFFRDDALDSSNSLGRDENRSAAAPPLRLQPGGRRSGAQGQVLFLRLSGADQRGPSTGFQVSGYRQPGRQPAAPRSGSAVRCSDGALRDSDVPQVRSACSASIN